MPALLFLTFVALPAAAGEWSSLGRLPTGASVKLRLKSGRTQRGPILQVKADSLRFLPDESRTEVKTKDLTERVGRERVSQKGAAYSVLSERSPEASSVSKVRSTTVGRRTKSTSLRTSRRSS